MTHRTFAVRHASKASQQGNVLLATMCVLVVLAIILGFTLAAISARYKTAWRTAAWHEALLTAESGVDTTIAQLGGLLPDVQIDPQTGVALGTSPISTSLVTGLRLEPGGLNLSNGLTLSISPDPLVHGGEGATTSQATVSIDVLNLNNILSTNLVSGALSLLSSGTPSQINVLRLRSRGIVYLSGGNRTADVSKMDVDLHRAALVKDPATGQAVAKPYVAREIEVLLKPVFPFANGVATDGAISAPNATTVFDSFSSASALASTNGLYDSQKRRSNIDVSTNSSSFNLGGVVYGNISTDGAGVTKDSHVTGTVNNSYFDPLPILKAPSWGTSGTAISGTKSIAAGALAVPARFSYTQINGTLHVTGSALSGVGGLLGSLTGGVTSSIVSTEADIYVAGDFTGTLIVDSGVTVRLYVAGNVQLGANGLQNANKLAANVEILGVPGAASTPTISIDTTGGVCAAVYAPTHNVTLAGNGDFSGAITASALTVSGSAGVHFDETLALLPGPLLGYSLVSWQEITP